MYLIGLLGVVAQVSMLHFEATCDMSNDQLYVTPSKRNNQSCGRRKSYNPVPPVNTRISLKEVVLVGGPC